MIPLKECTNCFGVVESKETICPLCGHEFEVEINELETVDTKLEKIDQEAFKVDYITTKKLDELETIEEHIRYAKAKNYQKSWLKYRIPEFKDMTWPQFYIALKKYQTN